MMAGNPSWWSVHPPSQQPSALLSSSPPVLSTQYVFGSSSSLPLNSLPDNQEPPLLWSQLLLGGLSGDEGRFDPGQGHYQPKRLENWEDQILNPAPGTVPVVAEVKKEVSLNSNLYGRGDEEFLTPRPAWSQVMPVSSPRSCVTSCNIVDFAYGKPDGKNQHPDHQSSECNSSAQGGLSKKARVQPSSSQPPLKVRKEKLGDRITALHQIVSPFGKTDTASVLLEAIGYIRFLQGQIEALSSPYLGTASSIRRNQQSVQGERSCAFPADQCQGIIKELKDIESADEQPLPEKKRKRVSRPRQLHFEDIRDTPKDLRSRGLCLVPVSSTQYVGSESGADYWAPATGGGF